MSMLVAACAYWLRWAAHIGCQGRTRAAIGRAYRLPLGHVGCGGLTYEARSEQVGCGATRISAASPAYRLRRPLMRGADMCAV